MVEEKHRLAHDEKMQQHRQRDSWNGGSARRRQELCLVEKHRGNGLGDVYKGLLSLGVWTVLGVMQRITGSSQRREGDRSGFRDRLDRAWWLLNQLSVGHLAGPNRAMATTSTLTTNTGFIHMATDQKSSPSMTVGFVWSSAAAFRSLY
jgi:hypothetical protein